MIQKRLGGEEWESESECCEQHIQQKCLKIIDKGTVVLSVQWVVVWIDQSLWGFNWKSIDFPTGPQKLYTFSSINVTKSKTFLCLNETFKTIIDFKVELNTTLVVIHNN